MVPVTMASPATLVCDGCGKEIKLTVRGINMKKHITNNSMLFVAMIFTFVVVGCNRERPRPSTPEAGYQANAPHVSMEITETLTETEEQTPHEELPPVALDSMWIWDAVELFDPITEIEMIFVEGGTMVIQGQEISLDSFYISKFVLTDLIWAKAHNWAHDRGYAGGHQQSYSYDSGSMNMNLGWTFAIVTSNWLSVMEGLAPVYWLEDRTRPVMRLGDLSTTLFEEGIAVFHQNHPFYIDWNANGYRLPTEAEWEFAARGGNESRGYRYAGGNILAEVLTNFWGGQGWDMSYILGQMRPNELGIHDMSSQAAEWALGPWTEYGELEPLHNPGRIPLFDFAEPLSLLQKGGNRILGEDSFRPESRIRYRPDADNDRWLGGASIRLIRNYNPQQIPREEVSSFE